MLTSIGCPENSSIDTDSCSVVCIDKGHSIKPIARSARLDDPVVTSIGRPDDGPMETNSRPIICIGEREPKEIISLGQWVLPNPPSPSVVQGLVTALVLCEYRRCRISNGESNTEQKGNLKELLLTRNCCVSVHLAPP
jgi:hypothetical protein